MSDLADLEARLLKSLAMPGRELLRKIEVTVDGRSVTLEGRVSTFYEKQLCIECVRSVNGLEGVIDKIEVEPERKRTDV